MLPLLLQDSTHVHRLPPGYPVQRRGTTCGKYERSGEPWHRLWDTTDATAQEDSMHQDYIRRWVFVSLLGGMFVLGFVSGSVSQRPAQAQVPGVGGALGSVTELGSSIVE